MAYLSLKPRGQQLTKTGEKENTKRSSHLFRGTNNNSWEVKSALSDVVSSGRMWALFYSHLFGGFCFVSFYDFSTSNSVGRFILCYGEPLIDRCLGFLNCEKFGQQDDLGGWKIRGRVDLTLNFDGLYISRILLVGNCLLLWVARIALGMDFHPQPDLLQFSSLKIWRLAKFTICI